MKKLVLFLFISFQYFSLAAQSSYNLLDTTNVWNNYHANYTSFNSNVSFVKDTIINGNNYHEFLDKTIYFYKFQTNTYVYLRETNNYIIRFIPLPSGSFTDTLYNFNAQVNDFIGLTDNDIPPYHDSVFVVQIDSVLIGSNYRKRWFNGINNYITSVWIDGIGSTNGLFSPVYSGSTFSGGASYLLCFENSGNLLYMDSTFNTCFISTSMENQNQIVNKVSITPNPISNIGILEYNGSISEKLTIRIYNILGQMILQQQLNANNEIQLSNDNLAPGQYIYQLFTTKSIIASGRFIVD